MSPPATLLMWFQLRSPELAEDFERLMTNDRDIVRGSLDTVSDWRLTRPADVPGQAIGQADYVLIAEIVEWIDSSNRGANTFSAWRTIWPISSRTAGCSSCVPCSETAALRRYALVPAADPFDDQAAVFIGCLLPGEVPRVERVDLTVR
jgi:hypothetical protein